MILEPVQNSGGSITPPEGYFERVREICDEHGVLLVADEVICGFGRVGDWFGTHALRDRARHDDRGEGDHLRLRAARSGRRERADDRAVLRRAARRAFTHGITFGGHPLSCAIALANLDIFEREDLIGRVQRYQGRVPRALR